MSLLSCPFPASKLGEIHKSRAQPLALPLVWWCRCTPTRERRWMGRCTSRVGGEERTTWRSCSAMTQGLTAGMSWQTGQWGGRGTGWLRCWESSTSSGGATMTLATGGTFTRWDHVTPVSFLGCSWMLALRCNIILLLRMQIKLLCSGCWMSSPPLTCRTGNDLFTVVCLEHFVSPTKH